MAAATLMSVHNLFHYLDIMRAMRQSIRLCRFEDWREKTLRRLAAVGEDGSSRERSP
jgi:queuine/archaeosine tRNA-ribosyltransferase